ncbi:RNA-directed DNA polymerase, eukaryota, reverse transcriptase zinc-binding domain protein [Tanacetum coccineum]
MSLSDNDLIKVEDTSTVLLAKVKEVDSVSNMYGICRNEGFTDVSIHYVGGLWVWIQFENSKSCEAFKENESLKSFWTIIRYVSPSFTVDERLIWIEIRGLPLCAWGSNAIKKVTSLFGKFKFFDSDSENTMSLGRACISTKRQSTISESVSVIIHGKSFDVHVHEIRAWSTIINDEYREPDEKDGEAESYTSNEEENPMDTLDDFVEQVVEEKGKSHSTNEGSHVETASSGGKPPGFENAVKKEDIPHSVPTKEDSVVNSKEEEKKASDSDVSIPPGFESLVKRDNECSNSSPRSKGDALGYDVKGCNRSLRKMLNGIGASAGKWKNSVEDYFLINVYGPQKQPEKYILWDLLRSFIQNHQGNFILFGDLNEVRCETERFGSNFSSSDAAIFNAFIQDVGLIDLPMGGKMFTWMNKSGSKLSKLDRFLISNNVLLALSKLQVTVLDRVWSDHNPILLHCQNNDFGPTPFKVYHSWFERCDFDNVVKETWNSLAANCNTPKSG